MTYSLTLTAGMSRHILMGTNGDATLLWPTGPIVGVIPDAEFCAKEMAMGENDLLLAYTDGITDALNIHEDAFGRERLVDLIKLEHTHNDSCNILLKNIERELDQFIGEAVQFDDITALALRKLVSG